MIIFKLVFEFLICLQKLKVLARIIFTLLQFSSHCILIVLHPHFCSVPSSACIGRHFSEFKLPAEDVNMTRSTVQTTFLPDINYQVTACLPRAP